jgi:hypothetical protein
MSSTNPHLKIEMWGTRVETAPEGLRWGAQRARLGVR